MTSKGFTLTEILVAMVVVGVIATVAIPNYNNYVVNSKIQSVENNLRAISAGQEKYHEDRSAYYTSANGVANDFGSINSNLSLSMASVNDGFNYVCAASGSCCASNATYPTAAGTSISVDNNGNLAVAAGAICAGPGFTCSGADPCGIFGACYAVSGCNNQCNSAEVNDACGVCNGNAGTTCPTNETCSGDACVCSGTTDLCGTCGGSCTAGNDEDCNGSGNTCECTSGYTGTPGSCVANICDSSTMPANAEACLNTPPPSTNNGSYQLPTYYVCNNSPCAAICKTGYYYMGGDLGCTPCSYPVANSTPCPAATTPQGGVPVPPTSGDYDYSTGWYWVVPACTGASICLATCNPGYYAQFNEWTQPVCGQFTCWNVTMWDYSCVAGGGTCDNSTVPLNSTPCPGAPSPPANSNYTLISSCQLEGSCTAACNPGYTDSSGTCVTSCSGTVDLCGTCGGTCTTANNEDCNGAGNTCECRAGYTGTPGTCVTGCSGTVDLCGTCGGTCTAANNEDCHGAGNTCECTYTGTPGSCLSCCSSACNNASLGENGCFNGSGPGSGSGACCGGPFSGQSVYPACGGTCACCL